MVISSFFTSLALSGIMVILPLYATRTLGLSNADFARVLSLRMAGITIGVILLGGLSDQVGTRRLTAMALFAGGVAYGLLGVVPVAGFLALIPVISGLLSTAFVNLNHLTQIADVRRQGRANTLYRATGTLAGILAPFLVTRYFDAAAGMFAVIGAGMCVAALALRHYPLVEPLPHYRGLRREVQTIAATYAGAFREKHLILFLQVSLLWDAVAVAVAAFIALRLTQELGVSPAAYGNACSAASALTLGGILALGLVLDRIRVKRTVIVMYAVATACLIALGANGSAGLTLGLFVVFSIASGMLVGPLSMWISREAGGVGLSTAFAVSKVLTAGYLAVATFALGWLEPRLGIRTVFLLCGLLAAVVVLALGWLREPPPLRQRAATVPVEHDEPPGNC